MQIQKTRVGAFFLMALYSTTGVAQHLAGQAQGTALTNNDVIYMIKSGRLSGEIIVAAGSAAVAKAGRPDGSKGGKAAA